MASESLIIETLEGFDVEEEFEFEETHLSDNDRNTTDQDELEQGPHTKCGEIMIGLQGSFTLVCSHCERCYPDLLAFGEHIHENHLNSVKDYPLEDDDELIAKEKSDEESPVPLETDDVVCMDETYRDYEEDNSKPIANTEEVQIDHPITRKRGRKKKIEISEPQETNPFCTICARSYKDAKGFRDHIIKIHGDITENVIVKTSGVTTKGIAIPVPQELICKYCDKIFTDHKEFREHIGSHTGDNRFICSHCSKTFRTKYHRRVHMYTHEGVRPFKCPHCPKTFSDPTNLGTHVRIHLKIYKYKCSFCSKPFVKSSDKRIHERVHTNERPFQCEECGNRFRSQVRLTEHIRRHKNIRNYKCEVCDKAFLTSQLLKNHAAMHSSDRPFSCNICGQTFTRDASLRQHKLLHSKVKKYICKACGKDFAQAAGLYSHMKSHGDLIKD